jgi:hypothetical protein
MVVCTGGNGTFTIQFQSVLTSTNNFFAVINDYSDNIIVAAVTRMGAGIYSICFLTNINLNICQTPTFSAQMSLPAGSTATTPTVVGSSYSWSFNANANLYPWTVHYIVNTNVGTTATDVNNASYTLQLVWPTKAIFIPNRYAQTSARILSAAAAAAEAEVDYCGASSAAASSASSSSGASGSGGVGVG